MEKADSLIKTHSIETGDLNWPPSIEIVVKDTRGYERIGLIAYYMKNKILTIAVLLASCNSNIEKKEIVKCTVDYEFRSKFQNCIQIMALREIGYVIRFEYTGRAYQCLLALTGQHVRDFEQ